MTTRPAKDRGITGGTERTLRDRWAAEARSHGHDPAEVSDVLHRGVAPRDLSTVELNQLVGHPPEGRWR